MRQLSFYLASAVLASAALAGCKASSPAPNEPSEDEVILHAWTWSFDNVAKNMKKIADAGYDYVQISPAQTCYVGEDGGMALFSEEGDSVKGKWYYYYQPTDWKVGNYMLGNRDQLKAMCDSAAKYGVRVIADVLPNHVAIDDSKVLAALDSAAGGHDALFHEAGRTPITDYNDRLQCTTGEMGGLKDVNTENPGFQHYYLEYVNDLLSLGVRGFRYDTAKHIGLPSDPLDPRSERNNFWDIATGREAVQGLTLALPADSLFIYGEVLQDKNTKETEYAEYMDLTASSYGHVLRHAMQEGKADSVELSQWHHPVSPDRLVTWVESHDTYCNAHESAGLSDEQIRTGWVFLTARQHGRPLFYSRPAGSTRENYWGHNRVGEAGNDEYFHPAVVAANKFRKAMKGQPEHLYYSADGAVAEVARGNAGAALVNFSAKEADIDMPALLPDGTYTDAVSGTQFTVADGHVKGKLAPLGTYILQK